MVDSKALYASEKVREAVRDHEDEVCPVMPKTKSKVVVLGDSGVGKTSIIYRHRFGDKFIQFNATIGASFVSHNVRTRTEGMNLQIWDTAGQERFRCMVPMYMRNASAAIIVYDITNRQSFNDVDKWADELYHCCGMIDPVVVLIGNKADLEEKRQVAVGEGVSKALRLNARFYELSANTPLAFSDVLQELASDLVTGGFGTDLEKSTASSPTCLSPPPVALIPEMEVEKQKRSCCSLI